MKGKKKRHNRARVEFIPEAHAGLLQNDITICGCRLVQRRQQFRSLQRDRDVQSHLKPGQYHSRQLQFRLSHKPRCKQPLQHQPDGPPPQLRRLRSLSDKQWCAPRPSHDRRTTFNQLTSRRVLCWLNTSNSVVLSPLSRREIAGLSPVELLRLLHLNSLLAKQRNAPGPLRDWNRQHQSDPTAGHGVHW